MLSASTQLSFAWVGWEGRHAGFRRANGYFSTAEFPRLSFGRVIPIPAGCSLDILLPFGGRRRSLLARSIISGSPARSRDRRCPATSYRLRAGSYKAKSFCASCAFLRPILPATKTGLNSGFRQPGGEVGVGGDFPADLVFRSEQAGIGLLGEAAGVFCAKWREATCFNRKPAFSLK